MATPEFFFRIEHLSLTPGPKQAGFVLTLCGETAVRLRAIYPTEKAIGRLNEMVASRLAHADVLGPATLSSCRVILAEGSAMPLVLSTGSFGGSIGAGGEELQRLTQPDAAERVGPVFELTPHNVDSPKEALALLVMAQTWGEWAYSELLVADYVSLRAQ